MRTTIYLALMILSVGCEAEKNDTPIVSSGRIESISNLKSSYVDARNIDVWLPVNYSNEKKYAVAYMHDGQMLFDSTKTWNKQEWMVDETLAALFRCDSVKECIVVGIWNSGEYRHSEYFPQEIIEAIPSEYRNILISSSLKNKPQSDNYLKFLVEELKPFIDLNYSTYPDKHNTFLMGSSMGGIISIYAICEYPHLFGGAACFSTHWPLVASEENQLISELFIEYLRQKLPLSKDHRIYFDFGNKTLDSLYKPYQILVDEIMMSKSYNKDSWITMEFVGHDHSERSWSSRLAIPFNFFY